MLLPVENVYKHHERAIVYIHTLECRRSAGHPNTTCDIIYIIYYI